jgi:hypothetical protein
MDLQAKNTTTLTATAKDLNEDLTWDEADFTWDESGGTWGAPGTDIKREAKNIATLTNNEKPTPQ